MDIDNIWAIDVGLLSQESMNAIRSTGDVGKTVWFANIKDDQVAFATFNPKDGTATQVQCVPSPSGKVVISRRSFFLKNLTPRDCSMLRAGRNILAVPYASEDPIVAGAPAEREVYFIDRRSMRVQVVIY